MKTLATMLADLMRADAVPMSDGWGQLYDRIAKIDRVIAEIYDPAKESTNRVIHRYHGPTAGHALYSNKAMWTCPSDGTLREQGGVNDKPPTCHCGRIMFLGVYAENTFAIEMPALDHAVCSAELEALGKARPKVCAVHGLAHPCPEVLPHDWVTAPGFPPVQACSWCGVRSDSAAVIPRFCIGRIK